MITGQPRSQATVVNLSATLDVYADGTAPLGYFWFKDGAPLPTATNLSVLTNGQLQFLPFLTNDAGVYHVVVSNAYGSAVSDPATMSALPNPHISQQPESQTVLEGSATSIGLLARGSEPVYYYWYKDGVYDSTISITTGTLLFPSVLATNAGAYQIIVSNAVGMAVSDIAVLSVKPNTPRQLNALGLEFPTPGSAVLPVQFAAQGDENALGFSLRFDPAILRFESVALTEEAAGLLPGAQLTVSDAEAAQGRLGLAVALAAGERMPAQAFRLLALQFAQLSPAWEQAGLLFENQPVPIRAADTAAAALPVLDAVNPMLSSEAVSTGADPQSGLFVQKLTVVNPSALKLGGIEVLVNGLGNDRLGRPIRLANASGSTNGVPLVYYGPVFPGIRTELTLTYYVADRQTQPTPSLELRVVPARQFLPAGGQTFAITNIRYEAGRVILDFETLAGQAYYVQYGDALTDIYWRTATPQIIGTGSRVQWIDDGPPVTISRPTSAVSRYYRGLLMP